MFGSTFSYQRRDSPQAREQVGLTALLPHGLQATSPTTFTSQPTSSTSLSGPFSQSSSSPYVQAAPTIDNEVSPLTARPVQLPAVPYNPQAWGPVSVNGGTSRDRAINAGLSTITRQDGVNVEDQPPPPYSQRPDGASPTGPIRPPLEATDSSSSVDSMRRLNGAFNSLRPNIPSTGSGRPLSMIYSSPGQVSLPPPPPTVRSSSSSRIESTSYGPFPQTHSPIAPTGGRLSGAFLQPQTDSSLSSSEVRGNSRDPSPAPPAVPPASRRAMSADTCVLGGSKFPSAIFSARPTLGQDRQTSPALPGPPPGPPPNSKRSTSASGAGDPVAAHLLRPVIRSRHSMAPTLGTRLEPPPPTPADFVPKEGMLESRLNGPTASPIAFTEEPQTTESESSSATAGSSLSRSTAKRDSYARGLRERKNARKSRGERLSLVFDTLTADRSGTDSRSIVPESSIIQSIEDSIGIVRSADATPTQNSEYRRPSSSSAVPNTSSPTNAKVVNTSLEGRFLLNSSSSSDTASALTPPLSPGMKPPRLRVMTGSLDSVSKVLPTPPSAASQDLREARIRPISHILHLPNDDAEISAYLSPQEPSSASQLFRAPSNSLNFDVIINESTNRHAEFLLREKAASSNTERLRLFSEYVLKESKLRRQWYADVWAQGEFDTTQLREGLFENTHQQQAQLRSPSTAGSTAGMSTEPPTPATTFSGQGRSDNPWWNNYQPALSPIASMSNDEISSRGRTSSRWWESQTGSESGGVGSRAQRSKRESKYMGLQRESIQAETDAALYDIGEAPAEYGPSDFPNEKANAERFGFYDEGDSIADARLSKRVEKLPKLDVSRFITLPPPFPRHYPALNNSHPALSSYRAAVRTCSELSEVTERRSRNSKSTQALQKDHGEKLKLSMTEFRANIKTQIDGGSITYAEAAEAEYALKLDEQEREKKVVQAEYDSFQDIVLNPLHDMLNERVATLTSLMRKLEELLLSEARSGNVDQTQEEGDEQPQLLEKLTQLKWLFEAREHLYMEIFQLLTDRNENYKKIVLLPYQQANNDEKVKGTETFFLQDYKERKATFRKDSLKRYQKFLVKIEEHSRRGVELQSSTYWDIAPGLLDVLQQIPQDLGDFQGIQIPETEYAENPSYHRYPLQYLYSVMSHAEKSSYQFIESQINLQCLLHEAKTAAVAARCKCSQAACERDGGNSATLKTMSDQRTDEEAALTAELRQATALIESQWSDSLGGQIRSVRGRIQTRLMSEGGWGELEQEEAIS